jgi:hypothetical protein
MNTVAHPGQEAQQDVVLQGKYWVIEPEESAAAGVSSQLLLAGHGREVSGAGWASASPCRAADLHARGRCLIGGRRRGWAAGFLAGRGRGWPSGWRVLGILL